MTTSWHDLEILARTVYGEARGESAYGRRAIVHVIRNRLAKMPRYGSSIAEVCQKPYQFSCWLDGDPNKAVIEAASVEELSDCIQASCAALVTPDFTGGATHYFSTIIAPPSWAATGKLTLEIGRHRFYTGIN